MADRDKTVTTLLERALDKKLGGDTSRKVVIEAEDLLWLVFCAEMRRKVSSGDMGAGRRGGGQEHPEAHPGSGRARVGGGIVSRRR
jgi:hypothetical protein